MHGQIYIKITVLVSTWCCCYYYRPCYHLYARYLLLYTQNKPHLYDMYCCSCSVFTVCATCNVISPLKYVLYAYISTFHSLCAVPNMVFFCSALVSYSPGMLLRYCLSDFELVPFAPVIAGITCAFTCHSAVLLLWVLCIL